MEAPAARHNQRLVLWDALPFIPPLSGHFYRRLDALCSRVHGKHHLIAKDGRELLCKPAELVVVEGAAAESHSLSLVDQGLDNLWVAVTLQEESPVKYQL